MGPRHAMAAVLAAGALLGGLLSTLSCGQVVGWADGSCSTDQDCRSDQRCHPSYRVCELRCGPQQRLCADGGCAGCCAPIDCGAGFTCSAGSCQLCPSPGCP